MAMISSAGFLFVVSLLQSHRLVFGDDDRRELRVTTLMISPYTQRVEGRPDDFIGFIPDLLDELVRNTNYRVKMHLVPDGQYGSILPNQSWTGLIGDLTRNHADLAAAPLTVTETRRQYVDFLDPAFMDIDLAVILKRDHRGDIDSVADLIEQDKVKYGIVRSGSTYEFFRTSRQGSPYARMYDKMSSTGSISLVSNEAEGIRKVRESTDEMPFAFIGENATLEYSARHGSGCDELAVVSGDEPVHPIQYGLAVRKSQLAREDREALERALRQMKESGRINHLQRKWWIEKAECSDGSVTMTSLAAILLPVLAMMLAHDMA